MVTHFLRSPENLPVGVELIGGNLTERDDGEHALFNYKETYEMTYPILSDKTDEVGTAFKVISIPTTVLLNVQGEEMECIVGPVSEEGLRQIIKKYQSYMEE